MSGLVDTPKAGILMMKLNYPESAVQYYNHILTMFTYYKANRISIPYQQSRCSKYSANGENFKVKLI